jgi:DNA-binding NarL/FixJ family response regulator
MKVLLIEDSDYKVEQITQVVEQSIPGANLLVSKSFRSGLDAALENNPDIILLDMTLPTFEVRKGELGGRTRPFGGREILRELQFAGMSGIAIIVVTQFDRFGEGSQSVVRENLMKELITEFPEYKITCVYYSGRGAEWRELLKTELVKSLL